MTDIIDFKSEKTKKHTDANLVMTAPDGSVWFKYVADYEYQCEKGWDGSDLVKAMANHGIQCKVDTFSIDFWALNEEDARNRVEAIKNSLTLGGQIVSEIPY